MWREIPLITTGIFFHVTISYSNVKNKYITIENLVVTTYCKQYQ